MGKEESKGKRIFSNIYVRNILAMFMVTGLLIGLVLLGLDVYTRHDQSVIVPELKGLTVDDAESILNAEGLNYEVIDSVFQKKGVPGSILEQLPKEQSKVKKGRTIYLTIQARGEEMVAIPDLKDFSQRQAEAQLNALGFSNIVVQEVPAEFSGIVVSVEYRGKALLPGQKIAKGSSLVMKVGSGMGTDSIANDYSFETSEESVEGVDEIFE